MIKKSVLLTALAIAGFAVTSLAQTVPNYVPSNGLVGWWPFNGNAIDESINTNNGTVNGATLTTDRFGNAGKAYSFDGVNDIIDVNNVINAGNDWSISFWYNSLNSSASQIQNPLGIGAPMASFGGAGFSIYGGIAPGQCPIFNSNPSKMFISDNTQVCGNFFFSDNYSNNIWYNISILKANNVYSIYINGVLHISGVLNNISLTELHFGNKAQLTFQFFNGKIDDIGCWNRNLTQQEITGLYNGNICYQTITVTDTLLINTNLTGFNPVTYQNTIKIWPNPTNDHITIDNGNLANLTGHQIKISNALGQQVFQSAITQQQFYVDMSTWGGNGIYFVNLINAQGVTIETRKIVLQ